VTHPSHTHDVLHPSHDHDVTINTTSDADGSSAASREPGTTGTSLVDGGTFSDTFSLPFVTGSAEYANFYFLVGYNATNSGTGEGSVTITNTSTATTLLSTTDQVYEPGEHRLFPTAAVGDVEGDNIEVEFTASSTGGGSYIFTYSGVTYEQHQHDINATETSDAGLGVNETSTAALGNTISETSADATPLHTHDPQAGVVNFPTETPSNCDLVINGTTVASNIGSGVFTETIDVSGEFVSGVNDIEVTSDSVGFISAYVTTQLFRSGREA
jgi:hypothetical protein